MKQPEPCGPCGGIDPLLLLAPCVSCGVIDPLLMPSKDGLICAECERFDYVFCENIKQLVSALDPKVIIVGEGEGHYGPPDKNIFFAENTQRFESRSEFLEVTREDGSIAHCAEDEEVFEWSTFHGTHIVTSRAFYTLASNDWVYRKDIVRAPGYEWHLREDIEENPKNFTKFAGVFYDLTDPVELVWLHEALGKP